MQLKTGKKEFVGFAEIGITELWNGVIQITSNQGMQGIKKYFKKVLRPFKNIQAANFLNQL